MLTLIQFIQLSEQKRLSIMKRNVIESNATDNNVDRPFASKPMSFKQYAHDWLATTTQDARDRFNRDAQAAASRLHSEPIRDQHQPTGETHATTCS
jgi:hypothetical protein